MLLNKKLSKHAFHRYLSDAHTFFLAQSQQLTRIIQTLPAVTAQYKHPSEKDINPAFCEIEHAKKLIPSEKRIWVLRKDMVFALGIKNAYAEYGNTPLVTAIDGLTTVINVKDRYGHPSLAMPTPDYDGSVYYAGWLFQHNHHMEVYLSSGRFHNNKLSTFEHIYIEQYISLKLIEAFGEQNIVFYDWEHIEEIKSFLKGELSTLNKTKRDYSISNNLNKDSLNHFDLNGTMSPLHAAVLNERIEIVRYLIDQGVDLNKKITINDTLSIQLTPLDIALYKSNKASEQIIALLLNAGAQTSPILNKKTHIIHVMAILGKLNSIKGLLHHNPALIYTENEHGQTALSLAASHKRQDVVVFLKAQKSPFKDNQQRIAKITQLSMFNTKKNHTHHVSETNTVSTHNSITPSST